MADVKVVDVGAMPFYDGEQAIPGMKFVYAGKALGVSTFGMNVIEMAADQQRYPEHDHAGTDEEEVYVLVRGQAILHVGDQSWEISPGKLVRVGPEAKRRFVAGPQGATIVALSHVPD